MVAARRGGDVWREPGARVRVSRSGVGEHTAEWDKVVHTKTTFEEADADWWAALSKKHNGEPIACVGLWGCGVSPIQSEMKS